MRYRKASSKWWEIACGRGKDMGAGNCPLCVRYRDCVGCPVKEESGKIQCRGTPHERWRVYWVDKGGSWERGIVNPDGTVDEKAQIIALDEWLYLKAIGQ